jgi:hypothetical protein
MPVKKLIFIFILCTVSIAAQTVGKIYDKDEADQLYGSVSTALSISKSQLESVLEETNTYIMFRISGDQIVILDDTRYLLHPDQFEVLSTDVFYKFSKSKAEELLDSGSGSVVYVEQRSTTLTLTYGEYTLEDPVLCPPFCN